MNERKTHWIKNSLSAAIIFACLTDVYAQAPDKVSHAEPLYFDLVRDLGARKGEKEFNIGTDFKSGTHYNQSVFLAEYEFAPINRLGLEAELDLSFVTRKSFNMEIPNDKVEGLRLSSQYSFFVSTKHKITLAAGYTQVIEFTDFKNYGKRDVITGTAYNPFFVAAKRWGNVHTLLYAGPLMRHEFSANTMMFDWQINTSFHYSIPQTKHFIGVEFNKEIRDEKFEMTVRPQVKVKINQQLALGFVTGFPIHKSDESISAFFRIIYEP